MTQHYSKNILRQLRNDIPIDVLIKDILDHPSKISEGYFRFLCPICNEFNTATNPKTNLSRCFRCEKNFNTIDMVMTIKSYSFKQAADYLIKIINRM